MAYTGKGSFSRGGSNSAALFSSFYFENNALGNVWYVNNAHASAADDDSHGQSPLSPLSSIKYACATAALADNGDLVLVGPQHVETVTGAAGVAMSKAGVTVRGVGVGRQKPVVNYTTAAGASWNVTADRCAVQNLTFTPTGFGAITAAMNVSGADFTMEDCGWQFSTGTNAPVLCILTAATAARLIIKRCRFLGPAISTQLCTACIKHEVGIDYVIEDCEFIGKLTSAILNATAILGGLVNRCSFHIYTGTLGAIFHNSSTPHVSNCNFVVASGTAPISGTLVSATNCKYTTEGVGLNAGAALTF